jgi:hypothetical protein
MSSRRRPLYVPSFVCKLQTSSQDPVESVHIRVDMRFFNGRNFSDCSKRSERTQYAGASVMRVYSADGRNIFRALSDHLYLLTVGVEVIVAPDQTHTKTVVVLWAWDRSVPETSI